MKTNTNTSPTPTRREYKSTIRALINSTAAPVAPCWASPFVRNMSERLRPYWVHRRKAVDLLADLCAAMDKEHGRDPYCPHILGAYLIACGVWKKGLSFADVLRAYCPEKADQSAEVLEAFERFAWVLHSTVERLHDMDALPDVFSV